METPSRELTYAQAIHEALAMAMEADDRVFLLGEDIGVYGGAFQVTGDLINRFGEDRVMDTPISELGGAGVAVGAALTGMRPVFELQFSDFVTLAMGRSSIRLRSFVLCWAGRSPCPWSYAYHPGQEQARLRSTAKRSRPGWRMFPASKSSSRVRRTMPRD